MNSRYKHILSVLIPLAALSACAPISLQHAGTADAHCPPRPEQMLGANELLRYYACVGSLPPADAAKEYEAVNQHFLKTASGFDRVKLAMLLSLPDTAFHSTAMALQLLTTSSNETTALPASLRELAQLLNASLAEQQHLDDKVHSLEKELATEKIHSDALQNKIDSVDDKVHSLKKELATEKIHSDALQNKIDSVKGLERNMTQRGLP